MDTQPIRWSNESFTPGTVAMWTYGEYWYTARIERDSDTAPTDYECYSKRQIAAWRRDEWGYIGIVVTVEQPASTEANCEWIEVGCASLWGIEDNSGIEYITDTARELAEEALAQAQAA